MTSSRRQLLTRAAAVAFALRDDTLARLHRLDPASAGPDDEAFWREVRTHFDGDPDSVSWNHAGLSPSPRTVRAALAREQARCDVDPSRVLWRQQDNELDGVRKRLARLLGCSDEQLALTPNATWGLHTAILGLPMQPGDEIVVTAHEYSRTFHAVHQRQQRDGIVVVEVPLATPAARPEQVAADVLTKCTPRTRLVVLSQATYLTGQLLPTAVVADALRRRGVPVLVDGAHGIGLMPDTFDDLGGAFYTACLHKWLMGPVGTGVFVCSPAWIDKLWPLCPADPEQQRRITKFEHYGTRAAAPFLALHAALDFHDWLGPWRKAARLEWLRQRLAAALDGMACLQVYSSLDSQRARAILAIGINDVEARPLVAWLWREHRMHTTAITVAGLQAVRLSPNVFTTTGEVDRLVAALRSAARDGI